jgi:hypothetical protein
MTSKVFVRSYLRDKLVAGVEEKMNALLSRDRVSVESAKKF